MAKTDVKTGCLITKVFLLVIASIATCARMGGDDILKLSKGADIAAEARHFKNIDQSIDYVGLMNDAIELSEWTEENFEHIPPVEMQVPPSKNTSFKKELVKQIYFGSLNRSLTEPDKNQIIQAFRRLSMLSSLEKYTLLQNMLPQLNNKFTTQKQLTDLVKFSWTMSALTKNQDIKPTIKEAYKNAFISSPDLDAIQPSRQ